MLKKIIRSFFIALIIPTGGMSLHAKMILHAPDGRNVEIKEGTPQPDLSAYRTPLESKIASRRFVTGDAFYLANEEFFSGMEFYVDAIEAGFPIAHWPEFQWVTAMESYWYSRYALEWAASRSHAGISMVHGPYWTLKARELYDRNRINRDRGERVPANKGVVLSHFMPLYYQRTGMPRVFDDAAPTYLNFASADPHFIAPVLTADDYQDPQSGKNGNWGVPHYWLDYFNTRWSRDKMDKTIDMGGTAQTALKQALWVQYFWHSNHWSEEKMGNDWGNAVTLLGNDAEEGFRGIVLSLAAFNTLLETKASLFSDIHGKLGGIDPFEYDPSKELRYIPHLITPNLVLLSDLPERPWSFHVKDPSSQLWDQASWLLLCSAYFQLAQRFDTAFTANPPVDGGILEKETGKVALGLAVSILKNIKAMHTREGHLVSSWTPATKAGKDIQIADAALTVAALKDSVERFSGESPSEKWLRGESSGLLKTIGDFLLKAESEEGAFYPTYSVPEVRGIGTSDMSAPLFWGIRGLLAAWQVTKEEKYLQGAYRAFNRVNEKFWDAKSGLYRSQIGNDTVTLTPKEMGAAIGALREITFAVDRSQVRPLLERFTRFWIQAMDVSGFQMAENFQTGELHYGIQNSDEDDDGIPFAAKAHGRYGVAPVTAGKVYVNIGGAYNTAFRQLKGESHITKSSVKCAYKNEENQTAVSPLRKVPTLAELRRTSGLNSLVSASESVQKRPDSNLKGAEIFRINCAVCHGDKGQGITGKPLENIAKEGGMEAVVMDGRSMQRMPSWGKILTTEEIGRVVEYVKTLFQK